jgi:hypothetical protein
MLLELSSPDIEIWSSTDVKVHALDEDVKGELLSPKLTKGE